MGRSTRKTSEVVPYGSSGGPAAAETGRLRSNRYKSNSTGKTPSDSSLFLNVFPEGLVIAQYMVKYSIHTISVTIFINIAQTVPIDTRVDRSIGDIFKPSFNTWFFGSNKKRTLKHFESYRCMWFSLIFVLDSTYRSFFQPLVSKMDSLDTKFERKRTVVEGFMPNENGF